MTRWRYWTRGGAGLALALGFGCQSAEPLRTLPGRVPGTELASSITGGSPATPGRPAEPVVPASAAEPAPQPEPTQTLDLGIALRLAGLDNPTVNLARERVREALARQVAARSLLLPTVTIGGNFYRHTGTLQAAVGRVFAVDRQSLYLGFGARAVGTGTVAFPGVRLFAHLGDAVYEPLAARQRVVAARSDAQAVRNEILLRVAVGYLELVGAEARLDVLRRGAADLAEVVRLTRVYAAKGQGREADANRAAATADLLRRQVRAAEEDVAVASARLCRLLNLDPAVRLRTPGGPVEPIRFIPEDTPAEPLLTTALQARPEVFARSAEVLEAHTRARQERARPWLPVVSVGYSGGLFGGGSDLVASTFGPLKGRSDLDVLAVWNFQGLGFGNRARVRAADADTGQAVAAYDLAVNQIRREVVEALAAAAAAARQIQAARAAVEAAEEGYRLEVRRITQGGPNLGRPIEVLDSFRQLLDSRQELIRATIAFSAAQFRLIVAVGNQP